MSYPAQPPQQPGGNPYAQNQPPQGFGAPQGPNQFPGGQFPPQQGQFGGGFPPPQPVRPSGNVGAGVLVGLLVALVTAGIYGAVIGMLEAEVGYAAIGVGFLTGLAAGKVGGRSPAVMVFASVFSLLGVYLGQMLGMAILVNKAMGAGVVSMLTEHFDLLNQGWKEELDFMTFLFFALAVVGAVSGAKKAS
ncbi:hypothetical protein ACFYVL_28835 [Streptomyces sp. NPDC004111]|uniref:hypothetical protein n=1 Tax=Streptomyces sp. NPDC004111 TaxID=3364690 RepID=UPI00369295F9